MTTGPIIAPPLSLFTRLKYGLKCWTFKIFVYLALNAMYIAKAKELKKFYPTFSKRYDVRPMLANRVFIPKSFQTGSTLPLYIDIHGGGFALCDPQTDDEFCHFLANTFDICVVSMNYRKSPVHPFPDLIHDATAVAKAIIADPELPVDHSKIAIGGFSAGGNITLAISQLDGIREHVKAVVPVYPVVDFSGKFKGNFRPDKAGRPDLLETSSPMFNWAYVSSGQDTSDPILSPIYASREKLPMKMFFVGCEYDYLCHEASIMAKKLAGLKDKDGKLQSGNWKQNDVKFRTVPDVQHGFTHVKLKGEAEVERQKKTTGLYKEIGDWLKTEALIY